MKSSLMFLIPRTAIPFAVIGTVMGVELTNPSVADDQIEKPDPMAAERYAKMPNPLGDKGIADLIDLGSEGEWACSSCHGDGGEGNLNVPRLAGLPAGYLIKQLNDFKSGERRNNDMQFVVKELSSEEMIALGHYYADLNTPASAKPAFNGDLDRGRQLALEGDWSIDVPACFSCHGSSGWGVGEIFPGIAGQHPVYTFTQLNDWHNGTRSNSPIHLMKSISENLSRQDMQSVADYLAGLVPPQARDSVDKGEQKASSGTPSDNKESNDE